MLDDTVRAPRRSAAVMINKVPEVTVWFWVIKILATTVGETFADYLNDTLGFGLHTTSVVMTVALVVVLAVQFRQRRYVPGVYWLSVVLISVVGTLLTDNITDGLHISLVLSTIVFAVALAGVFAAWHSSERSLSIHTIVTTRREAFYWLTVLVTFALGTAGGDLVAERTGLGYLVSAAIFAVVIAGIYAAHRGLVLGPVLAFWLAYIVTRPLGASMGDLLSQNPADGGLGLGSTVTSAMFLLTILVVVGYLTVTRRDVSPPVDAAELEHERG